MSKKLKTTVAILVVAVIIGLTGCDKMANDTNINDNNTSIEEQKEVTTEETTVEETTVEETTVEVQTTKEITTTATKPTKKPNQKAQQKPQQKPYQESPTKLSETEERRLARQEYEKAMQKSDDEIRNLSEDEYAKICPHMNWDNNTEEEVCSFWLKYTDAKNDKCPHCGKILTYGSTGRGNYTDDPVYCRGTCTMTFG